MEKMTEINEREKEIQDVFDNVYFTLFIVKVLLYVMMFLMITLTFISVLLW